MAKRKLFFASDYMEGAHQNIIDKMVETNMESTVGYGYDEYSDSAKKKIRKACKNNNARVELLVGGTQTNATVIGAFLRTYEGVISAKSGHIATHEAGAIELGGHKVLELEPCEGKITGEQIKKYLKDYLKDGNVEHFVVPGMVYISQPTEYGTLYSLKELTEISNVCKEYGLYLYVDGARLAYALSSPINDVSLADLARISDVFYIGGTKCGALFGEAVVIPNPDIVSHFFNIIKQHGACLAKGRMLGIQFDELFKDDLYLRIGDPAIKYAEMIKEALIANGYKLFFDSPTNQIFFVIDNDKMEKLGENVEYAYGEIYDSDSTVIRLATSWATREKDVEELIRIISNL